MTTTTIEDVFETFELMDDWDDRYRFLIDLGRQLPELPAEEHSEEHKVRGCSSQVWLLAEARDGKLFFRGDSDAHIVKGLVALILCLFSGKTPAEILGVDAKGTLDKLGLSGHLSPMRANGLASMVKRIQDMASAAA